MPLPEKTGKELAFISEVFLNGASTMRFSESVAVAVESILPGATVSARPLSEGPLTCRLNVMVETEPHLSVGVSVDGPGIRASSGEVDEEIEDPRYTSDDLQRRIVERIKLNILRVLSEAFQVPFPPWGILVGVRPVKLVHSMVGRGFTWPEVCRMMGSIYGLSREKTDLVLEVAQRQVQFFPPPGREEEYARTVSVYVGIPFCPTRCTYCSFAAYPMESHGHLARGFLAALKQEMEAMGELVARENIKIESIYFGGGTPTVFDTEITGEIVSDAARWFLQEGTREFTVEAGRPDTITTEKLTTLRRAGVNRISVNPQTLSDRTLQLIGRRHKASDFFTAFAAAREVGFPVINVDLIMGLPGETMDDVKNTLTQVARLQPENLTIHSLAVKRAATLRHWVDKGLPGQTLAAEMVSDSERTARQMGMHPFYLYRQRYIVGDLENVGYSLPGAESVFNIEMMEEHQSVIGIGGGAVTKLVTPVSWRVSRLSNPKCPATYARDQKELTARKVEALKRHFRPYPAND